MATTPTPTTTQTEYIIQLKDIWAKAPANTEDRKRPKDGKVSHGFDYGEKPSHSTFNWIMYKVMLSAVTFQQNGILQWDKDVNYEAGAVVRLRTTSTTPATDYVMQSLKGEPTSTDATKHNVNRDPSSTIGWWKKGIEDNKDYLKKQGNNHKEDKNGGMMEGIFILKSGGKLVIEA